MKSWRTIGVRIGTRKDFGELEGKERLAMLYTLQRHGHTQLWAMGVEVWFVDIASGAEIEDADEIDWEDFPFVEAVEAAETLAK